LPRAKEGTVTDCDSTSDRRWLDAIWPFVRQHLPPPPCRVLDIGCGPLGGLVPALLTDGYDAEGIDPEAPHGLHYHQVEFERYTARQPAAAMVASTSLHHVTDLDMVVELLAQRLEPGGVLVAVEWARERFDEATARWCFARLTDDDPGWLRRHRDDWLASGQPWDVYLDRWAAAEGMHLGRDILRALTTRFDTQLLARGPYFFADLDSVTVADEQSAIDAGHIQANGIRYVGRAKNDTE
jgi:SAM-dependent methyltransferase